MRCVGLWFMLETVSGEFEQQPPLTRAPGCYHNIENSWSFLSSLKAQSHHLPALLLSFTSPNTYECVVTRLSLSPAQTMATLVVRAPLPGEPMGIGLILTNHRGSMQAVFAWEVWNPPNCPPPAWPRKFVNLPSKNSG